jgi:hypothetical protein
VKLNQSDEKHIQAKVRQSHTTAKNYIIIFVICIHHLILLEKNEGKAGKIGKMTRRRDRALCMHYS